MKRKLLYLLLFVSLMAGKSQAQNTFAPVGAEWWYSGDNYNFTDYPGGVSPNITWIDHVVSVADTTIQGISCRKLLATRTQKSSISPNNSSVSLTSSMYVYDNTDTVFLFDQATNNFLPLYIFNAQEGDTICLKALNIPAGSPDSNFCFVVDSIRLRLFDTTHLRTFYTRSLFEESDNHSINWGIGQYVPGSPASWVSLGQYTERLGGTFEKASSFTQVVTSHVVDGGSSIPFPAGYLNCYSDPGTSIKRVSYACDSIMHPYTAISALNASSLGISIHPNPTVGNITLTVQKPVPQRMEMFVCDLSGRRLASLQLPSGQTSLTANLEQLSSGTYLLLLQVGAERYYHKLVIRR